MMDRDKLEAAVKAKTEPVYAATYNQVRDYYKENFSSRQWIGAMSKAISGSDDAKSKEYKAARRSIERHETGQYKGNAPVYVSRIQAAGMKLDPIGRRAPNDTITITVTGQQVDREERSWTATFTGGDAYQFANNPSYFTFFRRKGYPPDVIATFDGDDSGGLEMLSVT